MKKRIVTSLALIALITVSLMGCHSVDMKGSAEQLPLIENVRDFIDPDLVTALEFLPPILSLITRETVNEVREVLYQMFTPQETEDVTVNVPGRDSLSVG